MIRKQVDLDLKEDLILKKQIRQSTSKMLRRPSDFQNSKVSPVLLDALLKQKDEGRLDSSALQHWVNRFEQEFDACSKTNSKDFSDEYIEKQFQALHAELNSAYATARLNESVPQHKPLDSTHAKHKLSLSKKRSQPQQTVKEDKNVITSPKLGNRFQASNVTREVIINSSEKTVKPSELRAKANEYEFTLGREPDVVRDKGDKKMAQSKTTSGTSFTRNFVRKFTDSLEKKKTKKIVEEYDIPKYAKVEKGLKKIPQKAPSNPFEEEYEEISPVEFANVQPNQIVPDRSKTVLQKQMNADLNQHTESKVRCSSPEANHRQTNTSPEWTVKLDVQEPEPDDAVLAKKEARKKNTEPKAPFERFQNCLFVTFTACAPWCIMRKVYWKRETRSEELFTVKARRNSQMRRKARNSIVNEGTAH